VTCPRLDIIAALLVFGQIILERRANTRTIEHAGSRHKHLRQRVGGMSARAIRRMRHGFTLRRRDTRRHGRGETAEQPTGAMQQMHDLVAFMRTRHRRGTAYGRGNTFPRVPKVPLQAADSVRSARAKAISADSLALPASSYVNHRMSSLRRLPLVREEVVSVL
jgi:hypothetical protein